MTLQFTGFNSNVLTWINGVLNGSHQYAFENRFVKSDDHGPRLHHRAQGVGGEVFDQRILRSRATATRRTRSTVGDACFEFPGGRQSVCDL